MYGLHEITYYHQWSYFEPTVFYLDAEGVGVSVTQVVVLITARSSVTYVGKSLYLPQTKQEFIAPTHPSAHSIYLHQTE